MQDVMRRINRRLRPLRGPVTIRRVRSVPARPRLRGGVAAAPVPETFDDVHEFASGGWGEVPTQPVALAGAAPAEWPSELGPVLVISIRRKRMDGFVRRMGPWMRHMRRVQCTDGRFLRVHHPSLTRGQIGCYESHITAWRAIAASAHEWVTVLEDDVAIDHSRRHAVLSRVAEAVRELPPARWDFLSWGHGPHADGRNVPVAGLKHWRRPVICQGFFAYTIKRSLAQQLLQECRPMRQAVDMWFYHEFLKHHPLIRAFALEPKLCYVIAGPSETSKLQP